MGIITWIIFGLIAGVIAKFIMPGRDGGGFILTCILGIVGAVVGGWLATTFGIGGSVTGFAQLPGRRGWRHRCAGGIPPDSPRIMSSDGPVRGRFFFR